MEVLKVMRFEGNENAILPTRAVRYDAGLDLYASADMEIPASEVDNSFVGVKIGRAKIPTGIAVEILPGFEGEIRGRSGLAFNKDIICFGGTIDSSYRGELGVLLYNLTGRSYSVRKGDRIAQLVISSCELPTPEWADELSFGARGEDGFGHSGR
jgi:dUTP pyrophosphatase